MCNLGELALEVTLGYLISLQAVILTNSPGAVFRLQSTNMQQVSLEKQ